MPLIQTAHGAIRLPAYLPVTTFGDAFPLDRLVRPFLPRFADCLMVSWHYAQQMKRRPDLPVFVDSGGFATLMPDTRIEECPDGTGMLVSQDDAAPLTPEAVLEFQGAWADLASTLDFPIPPGLTDPDERARRLRLTLANAQWALTHRPSNPLVLFGSVQGWDAQSYLNCAAALLAMGFEHLAIGGLVPRARDEEFLVRVTREIRALMAPHGLLHTFGMGEPTLVRRLFAAGATSTDSSSYIKAAASNLAWDGGETVSDPSPLERAHLAVRNFAYAHELVAKTCDG